MSSSLKVGVVIIGAGITGTSIAYNLAQHALPNSSLFKNILSKNVYVLERHSNIGWETSSRSSEVIHASVYYKPGSLKATLCAQGNKMMYDLCRKHGIVHKNLGKLIVLTDDYAANVATGVKTTRKDRWNLLKALYENAKACGAENVQFIDDKKAIKDLEPKVESDAAVYFPTSGIIDSHDLITFYDSQFYESGLGETVFNSEVDEIRVSTNIKDYCFQENEYPYTLKVNEVDLTGQTRQVRDSYLVEAKMVINAAGLGAGRIASLAGIDLDEAGYRIKANKSVYFRWNAPPEVYPTRLIYPIPVPGCVGIHTTPDCYGGMRLGPHHRWLDEKEMKKDWNASNDAYINSDVFDLTVDEKERDFIFNSCSSFLPTLKKEAIRPDTASIHPKLEYKTGGFKDWVIREEIDRGLPGFVNVLGIDSPGLTSSNAIGHYVYKMLSSRFNE